jgi:hypothetical protein
LARKYRLIPARTLTHWRDIGGICGAKGDAATTSGENPYVDLAAIVLAKGTAVRIYDPVVEQRNGGA